MAEVTQPRGSSSSSGLGSAVVAAAAAAAAAVAAPLLPLLLLVGHALLPSQTPPTRHRTDPSSTTRAWRGARERTAAKEEVDVEVEDFVPVVVVAVVGGRRGCGGGGGGGGGGGSTDLCSLCCCCASCCRPSVCCCCRSPERRREAATNRTHASATAPRSRPKREERPFAPSPPPRLRLQRARQGWSGGLRSLP